jgi:hypothetical protein
MKAPRASPLLRPHDFPPLAISDKETIARARHVLDKAGYTKSRICEVLDIHNAAEPIRAGNLVHLSRLCGGTSLETLIKLFLLGQSVPNDTVQQALAPMTLEEVRALGLLHSDEVMTTALYELHADDTSIFALPTPSVRRPPSRETLELHREFQNPRIWLFSDLTIRRSGTAALCTPVGCGIQALLAAPDSNGLLAVDSNPRLVELASFNASFNGLHQVECRQGDVTQVAEGRVFDSIVSNPWVAIAPPPSIMTRAGSSAGESIYETLVRGLPRFLKPGGYAQIFLNWAHRRGEDDYSRLRKWVNETSCDAYLLRFATQDPVSYALEWLPDPPDENLSRLALRLDDWLLYYAQQGIVSIGSGLLTLRARPGKPNWFVEEDLPELSGPCSQPLIRRFQNQTLLFTHSEDQSLLNLRLRVVPEVRWEQDSQPGPNGWTLPSSELHLSEGFVRELEVDKNVIALLAGCRGQRTLREILGDLAASLQVDPASVVGEGIQLARTLLAQGIVMSEEELSGV